MKTEILTSSAADLNRAAELLRNGKRVVFPTETVYGLGANALDPAAVRSIFEAKGRPSDNPLIVHIADISKVKEIAAEIPEAARLLMDKFWPGPLTIILKRKHCIPDEVTAGLDTVGIRMPSNSVALDLLSLCNFPVAAPSANISGRPSPTDAKCVIEDMDGRVEGIIDGGDCSVGVESTVIDMTGEIPAILRPGGVTAEEISALIGTVLGGGKVKDNETPKAPGMKYTHYAPSAPVRILRGTPREIEEFLNNRPCRCGILTFDETKLNTNAIRISLGSKLSPQSSAKNLFRALRKMDKAGAEEIYAPEIESGGLWAAVRDRLYKAAGGHIINAADREIIFVCTGNTCRSPMAEGIFNSLPGRGCFATSAGLFAQAGSPASENAIAALKEKEIDIKNHRARQLSGDMLMRADIILTMTKSHKDMILCLGEDLAGKVMTLSEAAGESRDVSDPFGGSLEGYRRCAEEIFELVKSAYDRL